MRIKHGFKFWEKFDIYNTLSQNTIANFVKKKIILANNLNTCTEFKKYLTSIDIPLKTTIEAKSTGSWMSDLVRLVFVSNDVLENHFLQQDFKDILGKYTDIFEENQIYKKICSISENIESYNAIILPEDKIFFDKPSLLFSFEYDGGDIREDNSYVFKDTFNALPRNIIMKFFSPYMIYDCSQCLEYMTLNIDSPKEEALQWQYKYREDKLTYLCPKCHTVTKENEGWCPLDIDHIR
jgi:hypothetical protein